MGIFGFGSKETIYFPGCFSSAFERARVENYKRILKKIKTNFSTLEDSKEFVCCGSFLDEAGYEKQLRRIAKANFSYIKDKKIKKIIVSCSLCYITLANYQEMLPNLDLEVEFIISTVLNAIREDPSLIKSSFYEPLVYYDSCYLSRYLEFREQPRELLKLFGYNLKELDYSKEESLCCGSCGLLPETNSELSEEIAINFIKFLKRNKVKKLVTADIKAYYLIKQTLKKFNINDFQILELSELICDSLGIKKEIELEQENKEQEAII